MSTTKPPNNQSIETMNCTYPSWTFCFFLILAFSSCRRYTPVDSFRTNYQSVNQIIHTDSSDHPFLKVHTPSGEVYVLESWTFNPTAQSLRGNGQRYNYNRDLIQEGDLIIPGDQIALLETNDLSQIKAKDQEQIARLTIALTVNAIGATLCLSFPKACFGSCPTFYLHPDEPVQAARAEGFSSSIMPALEKQDIDPLHHETDESAFSLYMKNEALETHAVNKVGLIAVPKPGNEQVHMSLDGSFFRCGSPVVYTHSTINEGTGDSRLKNYDGQEYISLTDSFDLNQKEEIVLAFTDLSDSDHGLLVRGRQSLLSTFLLYTGFSYMGDEVSDIMARFQDKRAIQRISRKQYQRMESLDIQAWNPVKKRWDFIESIHETGPIAANALLVNLPSKYTGSGKCTLKVIATRGMWRLDQLSLVPVVDEARPVSCKPVQALNLSGNTASIAEITNADTDYLVTFPGDMYRFDFNLPSVAPGENLALFLDTQGYYLEHMRQEWLAEKNPKRLRKMIMGEAAIWRALAIEYKELESSMEDTFWQSTYSPAN